MNNTYQKIVIAVDGSEAAEKAFKKSIHLAKENDATLVITHVIDTRTFAPMAAYDASISEEIEEKGKELLEAYEQIAKEANVLQTKQLLKHGDPKTVLAKKVIPEEEADLIIMAATGLNAVERFIVGSVSERTVRAADCDVLIVK